MRLNPSNIEDSRWEIPTQIQAHSMLPDTEVSEVSSVAQEPMSQDATTSQGKSFKTIEQISWFQSMADCFKEALSQGVTAISINTTFLCINQPL